MKRRAGEIVYRTVMLVKFQHLYLAADVDGNCFREYSVAKRLMGFLFARQLIY